MKKIPRAPSARTANPPMAPPTIAPIGVEAGSCVGVGVGVGVMVVVEEEIEEEGVLDEGVTRAYAGVGERY